MKGPCRWSVFMFSILGKGSGVIDLDSFKFLFDSFLVAGESEPQESRSKGLSSVLHSIYH